MARKKLKTLKVNKNFEIMALLYDPYNDNVIIYPCENLESFLSVSPSLIRDNEITTKIDIKMYIKDMPKNIMIKELKYISKKIKKNVQKKAKSKKKK